MTLTHTYKPDYTYNRTKLRPAVHQPFWLDTWVITVMDIKGRGQPACQEEQKTCKEESMNVMHECDI